MSCFFDVISSEVARVWACERHPEGVKIRTTCVLPSFESLFVYVTELDGGFIAHDGGDTAASLFLHGMETREALRVIRRACGRSEADFEEGRIFLKFETLDWLLTAVITVSNTAAAAGRVAEKFRLDATGSTLKNKIIEILMPELRNLDVSKDYEYLGGSGRRHKFDLAIDGGGNLTLINTVTPYAASVNSKYVAFSDVEAKRVRKFAVHDGNLLPKDIALLGRVATVVEPANMLGEVAAKVA